MKYCSRLILSCIVIALWGRGGQESFAAELQLAWPLARSAYQTNEWIDLAVTRSSAGALSAGTLQVRLQKVETWPEYGGAVPAPAGDAAAVQPGSRLAFDFEVPAVAVVEGGALATEHLHLNGRLLRPGKYQVAIQCDGATASGEFDLYSHVRKTSFRLVNWGTAKGPVQQAEGEDSLGYNLFYGHYGQDDDAHFIRAGVDFMANCVMSGGHQMDLRMECDWSDPLVVRGGTRRVTRRAFQDRTRPNVLGVHFYDEPGLTWHKHPVTGEFGPHGVPSQVKSYQAAFGREPIPHHLVRADNPQHVALWRHWAMWKLGFMDAAWRDAQFGVSQVRPDFLSITQSQYGFSAFTDGYYFNVVRSLPITSGHGGYDDYGPGYFNPSYFLEMARARDLAKPCWYLPTWYGGTPADRFRMEQYLSFITGLQGMITPPELDPYDPQRIKATDAIVETNKTMARLGTIFTTSAPTRPPVAMLYSMSQNLHAQTRDMQANYAHSLPQGLQLPFVYLAGKMLQQPFMVVVEEDILDGTLAASHRAIVLTGIEVLDPKVKKALERFAAQGGLVLLTKDCTIQLAGAKQLGVAPDFPDAAIVKALSDQKKYEEMRPYVTVGKYLEGARPLAEALRPHFDAAGILPVLNSDQPGIVAARHVTGDVEYLFAVNATYDPEVGGLNASRPTVAQLAIPADGRPVYDALISGPAAGWTKSGDRWAGTFRFGVGQMRCVARTTQPIGGVQVLSPTVQRESTRADNPLSVEISAVVLSDAGTPLAGSIPLSIRVVDPVGNVRYDLYRATEHGALRLSLPLAANDTPGAWTVTVRELLANHEDSARFALTTTLGPAAVAGATERAVMLSDDRQNIFRFFRQHQDVTIVTGHTPYHQAAAQRLVEILRPWDVRAKIVPVDEVKGARELTAEEAATWVGLDYRGTGQIKAGRDNPPVVAGFNVRGPVILLGNAGDHPLIEFLESQRFLPYKPVAGAFPGRGRGLVAWQREAIGPLQESIALIAHDEAGLAEAIGTMYECLAGIDPLTPFVAPADGAIEPARTSNAPGQLTQVWQVLLPDRAAALSADPAGGFVAWTWDGSRVRFADGQINERTDVSAAQVAEAAQQAQATKDAAAWELAKKHAPNTRVVKFAAAQGGETAVAYWGGTLQVVNAEGRLLSQQQLPHDPTALLWSGNDLIISLADGRVIALRPLP